MLLCAILATALAATEPPANFPFDDQTMAAIAKSHIDGNVPAPEVFDQYLARDLAAFFVGRGVAHASVSYELMRRAPTQTGVSYPKYYAWVRVSSEDVVEMEGAARLSAINRTSFEVQNFVPRDEIVARPDELDDIFPAALIAQIRARAAGR